MKRTTILLPDNLAYLLDRERRSRGVSTAAIVREAVAAHFNVSDKPRRLRIKALGRSGQSDIGENFDRYLDEEWGSDEFFNRTMGRYPEASVETNAVRKRSAADGSGAGGVEVIGVPPADDGSVDHDTHGD